jgi:glycerol-3-phosphate acyltransferase PlsY
MDILAGLGFIAIGYLAGSASFALWVTRAVRGVDVRDAGSHHATATNTIRQAGWLTGIAVLILDISKGFFPTYFASQFSSLEWVVPLTAVAAVVGHCWPLYAQFRGGMGLATAGGSIAAVYPLGFAIGMGILILLALVIKHSARASVLTGIALAPSFWLAGERGVVIPLAIGVGIVLAVRFYSDWNRKYRELWLDREKPAP